jgi:YVTN family beta-propeller protein
MKTVSVLRPTAWAGAITLALGMQAALAEPLMYVPLGGAGRIAVVDAAKDKIVDTIGGVAAVHGLASTPDGQFLIAGSFEEREAGSAAPAKPAGVTEEEHAAHHGGAVAKPKNDGPVVSTVSVVRVADGSVVRRIDVPGAVHHVAVGPDGRFAVVTRPNEGGISVIDLTSYEVTASLSTGPLPNYAVFSPDGGRVYVSNAGNDTVSEVDTGRWIVRRNFGAGSSPEHMVPSRDGQRLYVANADGGTVSEIATESGATLRTFDIGGVLHGIDLSDNGRTLFVAAREQDKLVAVSLHTSQVREVLLDPAPYHLASVGGTGKIYVSSAEQPNVWVIDQKDLAVLGKVSIGGKGHQMALAPGS